MFFWFLAHLFPPICLIYKLESIYLSLILIKLLCYI